MWLLWLVFMIQMHVTRYVKRKSVHKCVCVCVCVCASADTIIPCYFMAFHFFREVKAIPCLRHVTER